MPYAIIEYFCSRHGGLERCRIQILRSNRFKDNFLDPVLGEGRKGTFLKAVRIGGRSTRSKKEIERFIKEQLLQLGASQDHPIKIDLRGWF